MKTPGKLDPVIHRALAERLADTVGIEPSSLDAHRVEWIVERRTKHLHLVNGAAYLAYLEGSTDELAELVDALLIQETQFFRDAAVFEQIAAWAQRLAQTAQQPLRFLSAPCSTGQEAYSLAGTLAHAGLPPASFTIDAFDLSAKAIATAREGVYPEGALRNAPAALARACAALQNHHWHMHECLRDRLHFQRRNLVEPGALGRGPAYHLILCRNLFIYLHARARAVLADSLAQALLPGGRLIIGAADRVPELDAWFAPIKPASSFAFLHKEHVAAPAPEALIEPAAKAPRAKRARARAHQPGAEPTPAGAAEFYRRARDHYNRGNLREAERRCRQALYLAPAYLPALELLQSLWQLHPNLRLRRALRERIRRACLEEGVGGIVRAAPFMTEGGPA